MSRHTSIDMKWHKNKCVNTKGVLRHPADALILQKRHETLDWGLQQMGSIHLGIYRTHIVCGQ